MIGHMLVMEGNFVPQCGICTRDYVCTNDKLLCARGVLTENVLAYALI